MKMNISIQGSSSITELFRQLGQPLRLQIILIIARESACVCHMEAVLGIRQAAISQQLMILRDSGLVITERDGRNIFYRLAHPELYDGISQIAISTGISKEEITRFAARPVENCPCPKCNPGMDPDQSCKKIPVPCNKKKL
ncbi:ArsR family transcriptional regulator [bacterium]|jgi:ArsR family transcriptional regulator|nr:ArsR family transcriptional regulator [bacterium]